MAKDNTQYSPDTFKVLLKKLVQSPTDFTPEDCAECFRHLVTETASEAQVCSYCSASVALTSHHTHFSSLLYTQVSTADNQ
jgi:hypothetical protein